MSRFWRGLMLGGALGAMLMVWATNRQRRQATFKDRMVRSANRTAWQAKRRMGTMLDASRRRAATLMPNRK